MEVLAALAESGAFAPVIDRHYPLEHIAEAYRHVEKGHKKGSVVLTVDSSKESRLGPIRDGNEQHARIS